MHKRLKALARAALSRHDPASVTGTLALGWDTALLEAAVARDLVLALWDGADEHVERDLDHAAKAAKRAVNLGASWQRYGGMSEASGG